MVQLRQIERRLKVIELLREGKTETDIAESLGFGRNTIVRDVRWLKQNIAYNFNLITNEILQKLQTRIDKMTNRDLINFLGKLIPQKVEAKTEYIEERTLDVNITALLAELETTVEKATNRTLEKDDTRKQVDTTQAYAETS